MACSSTSAIPWPTKMTRSGLCGLDWGIVEALGQLNTRLGQERGAGRVWGSIPAWWWSVTSGRPPPGTVGTRRDPQPRRPPARPRHAQYGGDQRWQPGRCSAACLPVPRHPALARAPPAPGGLSGAVGEYGPQSPQRPAALASPLVGREQEVGLLRERWAQVKDGLGQGCAQRRSGDWQSRLVQVLTSTRGRRAPGMVDAVPVFAVLPEHGPVSDD